MGLYITEELVPSLSVLPSIWIRTRAFSISGLLYFFRAADLILWQHLSHHLQALSELNFVGQNTRGQAATVSPRAVSPASCQAPPHDKRVLRLRNLRAGSSRGQARRIPALPGLKRIQFEDWRRNGIINTSRLPCLLVCRPTLRARAHRLFAQLGIGGCCHDPQRSLSPLSRASRSIWGRAGEAAPGWFAKRLRVGDKRLSFLQYLFGAQLAVDRHTQAGAMIPGPPSPECSSSGHP